VIDANRSRNRIVAQALQNFAGADRTPVPISKRSIQ
jgi:hypothetical protein